LIKCIERGEMDNRIDMVVGTLIYRAGAYILDKFLENQKKIQGNYPSSELVLATVEKDFVAELKEMLSRWGVRGEVILYETVKPDYAISIVYWNCSCGREAIRKYALEKGASYLLFIDADLICDPQVINILKKEINGYDIVACGYAGKRHGTVVGGLGFTLITSDALKKMTYRCYEFKNHKVLDEGEVVGMDSFEKRLKFKNGYFLTVDHYDRDGSFGHIEPHSMSLLKKVANCLFVRYMLMKTSIIVKYNIPTSLKSYYLGFFQRD